MFYRILHIMNLARLHYLMLYLFFMLCYSVSLLPAQAAYEPNVPNPPAPPSQSINIVSTEISGGDPSFPQLELTEAPLDASGSLSGNGFIRSALLYRNFILEAFSGYYGAVLNLYNIHTSEGNSNGNTREADWNNLYNIIVGAQVSGNIRKFHYSLWFAMPFNMGADYIQLRDYEFGTSAGSSVTGRKKDDISYRGTLPSKVSSLFLGGLQLGLGAVDRKSAKLILGIGAEGFMGQWNITGGNDHRNLLLNVDPNSTWTYADSEKTASLFAVQVLPFVYLQGGAFLSPFIEIFGSIGYSPVTLWATEENRFYEIAATQYHRYGFWGQTILGEFQARLWLNRRFTVKLGIKGRFTLKTAGILRTYKIDIPSGEPVDEKDFDLTFNAAAMQHWQVSAFVGVGLTFDAKLPPGRKYAMPF